MNTQITIVGNEALENSINTILNEKFAEVSKELKAILKVASKGERKGLMIFIPEAARKISHITDDFVRYVVRSIYDNYADAKNGIIWRMHFNELFNGDFIKSIFRQLNEKVDNLENEYKELRESNLNNAELETLRNTKYHKYDMLYRKNYSDNVFNINNEVSKPFFEAYRALKAKVKAEHPRVPDDKINAYIKKTYEYNRQFEQITKDFLNTFPEYVSIENRIDAIHKEGWKKEKELSDKIKAELETENYTVIKKCIQKLVDNFCNLISNSIITGTI